jgi:tripartite-type tricarboxylate transporter receptor subunit TctC
MDDVDGWYALVAPAKTPAPIIAKLHQELKSIMALPEIKDGLAKQGLTAMSSTPQELDATIRSDLQRWAQLIKQAKIAAD